MSQNRSVTRHIRQILGISEDCLFILGFLVGCFTTYGLVHLHGQETCSAQSQRVPSAQSQTDSMLDFRTFDQYSPCLTEMLRKVIVPPSNLPYNLENGNREHSHGQAQLIKKLFKGKRKGFFIEAGALDGERGSNSLSLEKDLDWSGLLAEGDPSNIELIKSKNRKSFLLPNCLSLSKDIMYVAYRQSFNLGKVVKTGTKLQGDKFTNVVCFPLYGVLKALNVTKVDYFSLDVEGNEMDVLRTIPFDLIDITALSVEYIHIDGDDDKNTLKKFMDEKGYSVRAEITDGNWRANDYIFVKKGFNEDVQLPNIHTKHGEVPNVD